MKTLSFLIVCGALAACSDSRRPVAHFKDYEQYLTSRQLVGNDPIREEVQFWSDRLKQNANDLASLAKLAGLYAELFKITGSVDYIILSDSLFNEVLVKSPDGNPEVYQSLAANAVSQHKFQEAKSYAEKALTLNDKKAASLMILVDVSLEIGDYARANQILPQFKNKNSFAYLIRKAKVQDHAGMLDSAIVSMEKAYERIKGNKSLSQWALSNLADMYGHDGRIEKAYQTYLRVLENNPNDDYALKGIAWISFSHDGNYSDARRIVNALAIRRVLPEAHLFLAEIAEMEGDESQKKYHLSKFKAVVSKPAYKLMYHKYLALLEAEEFNPELAIAIAEQEIANRPTPQSYDLLAWAFYNLKDYKVALDIATRKVEDQTFEPDALYHLGMIYLANGNVDLAKDYLTLALESEFELGPTISKKIKTAIQDI